VVANGEIWTIDDLRRCRDETGCQHFMLGRGALADPTLGRKAAHELGVPGAGLPQPFARAPADWPSLNSRYGQLCNASGLPAAYVLCRVKQWLRMGNRDGKPAWFDTLKGCRDLGALLHHLGGQALDFPPSRREFSFSGRPLNRSPKTPG
jgi:tRNA-dihydrouridine synthase C